MDYKWKKGTKIAYELCYQLYFKSLHISSWGFSVLDKATKTKLNFFLSRTYISIPLGNLQIEAHFYQILIVMGKPDKGYYLPLS